MMDINDMSNAMIFDYEGTPIEDSDIKPIDYTPPKKIKKSDIIAMIEEGIENGINAQLSDKTTPVARRGAVRMTAQSIYNDYMKDDVG